MLDMQFHRVARGFAILLTADYGNCDEMIPVIGEAHTQHMVFCSHFCCRGALGIGRGLADVVPTVLYLLGIDQSTEMAENSIVL